MKTELKKTTVFFTFTAAKSIILTIIIILTGSCQSKQTLTDQEKENVKIKAEALYSDFFRLFNEMKLDSAAMVFSDDVYCSEDGELWTKPRIKEGFKAYSKTLKQMNGSIDSLHTRVISKDAAQITAYYTILQIDTANKEIFVKGVQTVLINPNLKTGFISECIESNDYTAIQYNDQIPKEFQTGYVNLNWRHGFMLRQYQILWAFLVDIMKQKGISPVQTGELMGKKYAPTWNEKEGFDGLSKNMVFIAQTGYSRTKVLERSANSLKIEFSKDYKGALPLLKVSDEDITASFVKCFEPIAERMGANLQSENKENSFTITFTRK